MTATQILLDVSKAIATQLWTALKDDPHTNTIITNQDQIAFSAPKTAVTGKNKLSVFLYSITPDQAYRNIPSPANTREAEARQAVYSARYIIAPCTGNAEHDLLLLAKILQTLSSNPFLETEASVTSNNKIKIMPDSLSLDDFSKLWIALDEPLKPCASFTISPISFGIAMAIQEATPSPAPVSANPHVMELYQTVYDTFEQQINVWKSRNFFQKQFFQSDFAKNTSMTLDDMHTELRALGEKLQTNRPIKPHMEALKKLQEFYEHQQETLKGFEKVQKKRQEGIDMVAKWKADVTALIEELNKQTEIVQR